MDRAVMTLVMWLLFVTGLFGFGASVVWFVTGRPAGDYTTSAIVAGFYLFGAAAVAFLRRRL
jgi:hypothetical protein